jgi:hypothetical protein
MDEDIGHLVSNAFYGGNLVSDPVAIMSRVPNFLPGYLRLKGLYWLDYRREMPSHKFEEVTFVERDSRFVKWRLSSCSAADKAALKAAAESQSGVKGKGGKKSNKAVDSQTGVKATGSGGRIALGHSIGTSAGFETSIFKSFANASEIVHILDALRRFVDHGILSMDPTDQSRRKSVAVICFYKQHLELLEIALVNEVHYEVYMTSLASGNLRLMTVDSSQGSEADIVLLSCVRSNPEGNVGFLSNLGGTRRLCVALSRAREALVIIGDPDTLISANSSRRLAFDRLWPTGPSGELSPEVRKLASFEALQAASAPANFSDFSSMFGEGVSVPSQIRRKTREQGACFEDAEGDFM